MIENQLYLISSNCNEKEGESVGSKIAEIQLFQRMRRVQEKKQRIQERVEKYNMVNINTETDATRIDGLLDYRRDLPQFDAARLCQPFDTRSLTSPSGVSIQDQPVKHPRVPAMQPTVFNFLWEINFNNVSRKEVETIMFFFGGVLWKASFGLNRTDPNYYYYIITPAQKLERNCKLMCKFRILNEENVDYIKCHQCDYCFLASTDETVGKGHSKFIRCDQLTSYFRKHATGMRLQLSLEFSTLVGVDGELLGYFSG